jgi:ribosomal protein S18 acetylase RimI-like enzyme
VTAPADHELPETMSASLTWRTATPADARPVVAAIDTWWDRHLEHFVHPLIFEHFGDTCLVVEDHGRLVAFLVGVLSQRHADQAYVHFIGVHPAYRGRGLGRELYVRFFALARESGRTLVVAETGAFNRDSIAFHRRLGFLLEEGDVEIDGVPVQHGFHGTGEDVVLFLKRLDQEQASV